MQIHFLLLNIYCFFCHGLETPNSDKLVAKVCNFTLAFINKFASSAEVLFFNSELAEVHPISTVK